MAGGTDRKTDSLTISTSSQERMNIEQSGEVVATSAGANQSQVIKLNVGGCMFETTRATLCRVPGSTLEAMFSERHQHAALRDDNGAYFIDRDGKHFHHILSFLRVGTVVSMPSDEMDKLELAIEADYYCLEELAKATRLPEMNVLGFLSDEALEQREFENKIRSAQWNGNNQYGQYGGLKPLFCSESGDAEFSLEYQPPKEAKFLLMKTIYENPNSGTPVAVASLQEFQKNFNRIYPNILHRLHEILVQEPVVLAGGSVLHALTAGDGVRTASSWGKTGDIDLFLHTKDPVEATRIAKRIFYALAVDNEMWVVVRSRGVINIHRSEPLDGFDHYIGVQIQIVLRLYGSVSEILLGFDCDCICCAYDGRTVWASSRCVSALCSGTNILNPLHAWPNKPSYELRLGKYAARGFAVLVPGLDQSRIDYAQVSKSSLANLKGLARLVKVSLEIEAASQSVSPVPPSMIQSLKRDVRNGLRADERLTQGLGDYDEQPEGNIISRCYFDDWDDVRNQPTYGRFQWTPSITGFPSSNETRDEGWGSVEEADRLTSLVPDSLPLRLLDAWECESMSRERLNAHSMDEADLNRLYYAPAYDN